MTHRIAVVCALREELSAVKAGLGKDAKRFELVQTGVGARAAARVGKEFAERENPPALIVSTGFCGGLIDALSVGGIVAAHNIICIESSVKSSATPRSISSSRAKSLVENKFAAALGASKLHWKLG